MSKQEDSAMAMSVAGCLVAIVTLVAGVFLRGLTLSLLWGWFVVPLGPPAVGLWHALGLAVLANLVAGSKKPLQKKDDESELTHQLRLLAYAVFMPLAALGVGWCVHELMIAWPLSQ